MASYSHSCGDDDDPHLLGELELDESEDWEMFEIVLFGLSLQKRVIHCWSLDEYLPHVTECFLPLVTIPSPKQQPSSSSLSSPSSSSSSSPCSGRQLCETRSPHRRDATHARWARLHTCVLSSGIHFFKTKYQFRHNYHRLVWKSMYLMYSSH